MNQPTGEGKPPLGVLCLFVCFGDQPKNFPKISVTPQSSQTQTIPRHLSRANSHLWHSRPKRFSLSQTNARRLSLKQQTSQKVKLQKETLFILDFVLLLTGDESRHRVPLSFKPAKYFPMGCPNRFSNGSFLSFFGGGTKRGIKNTSG